MPEEGGGTRGTPSNSRSNSLPTQLQAFYQNLHRVRMELDIEKISRHTMATLKLLIFFDVCYFIASIVLVCVGFSTNTQQRDSLTIAGGVLGLFSIITFSCNSLAVHGLRTWKRLLLVPWLIFWLIILGSLVFQLITSVFIRSGQHNMPGFQQALELILCFCVFSVWCNMRKQVALMAHSREELQSAFNVDNITIARDLFASTTTSGQSRVDPAKDLPPKYEDCTDAPPAYNVETMVVAGNENSSSSEENALPSYASVTAVLTDSGVTTTAAPCNAAATETAVVIASNDEPTVAVTVAISKDK